ncbi:uncharacterized protein BJ212DRAFT_1483973 [Suillus subaureus]|uniref:Importin subunit beta-1/Transportin-1-like TPR repeats domain-containing protein n=1 Tax=Suillus subaureus TaxID=48587 RepID=A0A9P7E555_9AGAM|nr:uncharacterized protein BJ212DRAFT_1483973 [Suillus subaureus]KAG1810840.1 hypothetical protein BJ212DRAFT_1483973 [Suillus subaureus]
MPITLDSGTRHFMSTLSNLTLNHICLSTALDMTSIEITQWLFGNSLKTSVIEYVAQLWEGILETYTVVVTAFKNTEKAPALLPYVPSSSLSINV